MSTRGRRTTRAAAVAALVSGMLLAAGGALPASAATPSLGEGSGSPAAWYVSFHGSADSSASAVNQLLSYDAGGALTSSGVLPTGAGAPSLAELRGMALATDGSLLVANATKTDSTVLHYGPSGGDTPLSVVPPGGVLASSDADSAGPGLAHPYGVAVLPSGEVLVSSQDSQVVTRLTADGLPDPASGGSSWWSEHHPDVALPPGTVAPSASEVSTKDGGLSAPRGIVVAPATGDDPDPVLYVADNGAKAVRSYDAVTGQFLGDVLTSSHDGLGSPVGLALHDGRLFVTSEGTDDVMSLHLATGSIHRVVTGTVDHVALDHPSGIAFGSDGRMYVASRVAQQIVAYTLDAKGDSATSASVFVDHLPDQPEQLLGLLPAGVGSPDPGTDDGSGAAPPPGSSPSAPPSGAVAPTGAGGAGALAATGAPSNEGTLGWVGLAAAVLGTGAILNGARRPSRRRHDVRRRT